MNKIVTIQRFGGAINTPSSNNSSITQPKSFEDPEEQINENLRYLNEQASLASKYSSLTIPARRYGGSPALVNQTLEQKQAGQRALKSIEEERQKQLDAQRQVKEYKEQLENAKQEEAAYNVATRLIDNNSTVDPNQLDPKTRAYYLANQKAESLFKQRIIKDSQGTGFNPVFAYKDNVLTLAGYEDVNRGVTIPLSSFQGYVAKVNYISPTANVIPRFEANRLVSVTPEGFKTTQLYFGKTPDNMKTETLKLSSGLDIPAFLNKDIASNKYNISKQKEPNIYERFVLATKNYSLFGSQGVSVSGTINFVSNELGKSFAEISTVFASNKPRFTLVDEKGNEIVFGKITNEQQIKLSSGQAINEVFPKYNENSSEGVYYANTTLKQELKQEALAVSSGVITGLGFIYGAKTSPGALGSLLTISGSEQYLTPKGKENLNEASKIIGNVAYVLPAAEIVAGLYGVRQGFLTNQLEALKQAKYEVSLGKPFSINDKIYLQQVTEQRIPFPSIIYKPKPFVLEPTLKGSEFISPRLLTIMQAELTPTELSGFSYIGQARTGLNIIDITGGYKKIVSAPYDFSGRITPQGAGRLIINNLKLADIEKTFAGKTIIETDPALRESFAGFQVRETKTGIKQTLTGTVNKLRYYQNEDVVRAVMNPKTMGFVLPEDATITKYFEFPAGKGGQVSLFSFEKTPSLDLIPTNLMNEVDLFKGMGQSVARLGGQQFSFNSILFKFPAIETTSPSPALNDLQTPRNQQIPRQINITKQVTISKQIQIPKDIQITKETQITRQAQIPKQAQVPKQVQIPKQIEIGINLPINAQIPKDIIGFGFLLPEFKKYQTQSNKTQSYNVMIKEPKQKQFKQVPNKNLNKQDALNLGSYLADNSTARTYYIKPAKAKPQPLGLNIPQTYFLATRDKFRDYQVKQGKKVAYNGYIEKNNYLLDTSGEINEISAFKELSKIKKSDYKGGNSLQNYALSL